ncbi:chemotaxis protein CheA [Actinotalea ferrariae]|uniref:chemotaxis protein CheA n=1 Tax=Actinotalea ferrariae TaxID=1386098 RepID=UPI001C8C7092|nr:chemotaxis protein CheA [Actinotalea ferrariae]MBX9245157.1 chemotaxis protein CheA [Actinotalea ferrariae]
MEDLDEIVHEFLVESHENLDQLDSDLVALEAAPGSRELLSSIFRTIHTIKGTSGFLAFSALESVTHAGENLLVELRDGLRSTDQATTDVLLEMVDVVRDILRRIEAEKSEGDVDVAPVVARIQAVLDGTATAAAQPTREITEIADAADVAGTADIAAATDTADTADTADATQAPGGAVVPAQRTAPPATAEKGAVRPASADPHDEAAAADPVEEAAIVTPEAPAPAAETARPRSRTIRAKKPAAAKAPVASAETPSATAPSTAPSSTTPSSTAPSADTTATPAPAATVQPTTQPDSQTATSPAPEPARPAAPAAGAKAGRRNGEDSDTTATRSATDGSIRVDVELLDALMRQVGELVLARNAISRLAGATDDVELVRASQRLSLIASELQEGVMKTRMQPIEHVWSKVPRMVRDLAAACDKQVRLEMIGGDTELDRSLLEAIKDPLTHLIRNAVDHGIEPADRRLAAGKPAQGVLSLRASHSGGQVVVDIVDDGHGIDVDKVAAKAVERGLRTAEQVALMAPADLLQLLFLPGFSTADAVTNVSGRGVGMDVVRTRIEAIGGTVDVESELGRGTTWRLRIPLTLAIMPALTVACDGELYAIPQVSLLELVALDAQTSGAVEYVRSAPVYRLRGELLPLVELREVFGADVPADRAGAVIAVLEADSRRFGLLVDRVLNTEEIVVKPLSGRLKAIGLYAGATLLGDGRVSLILDIQAIGRRAMAGDRGEIERSRSAEDRAALRETVQVLVAGIGDGRRVAIPLASVTRLEKLPASLLEHVGGREVLQYRGSITPVVRLDRMLGSLTQDKDELTVVVSSRRGRSVAIVVDQIVDIVDDDVTVHSDLGDLGLVGSTVLKDRVTELLDVRSAVAAADPLFYADGPDAPDDDFADELEQLVLAGGTR